MTEAPRWSVVIPTFNRLPVLREVLEALAVQDGPPCEVIVVDDGSTDGTADWLDEQARGTTGRSDDGDGKPGMELAVIHQSNRGPAAARNRGVGLARGRWVAFLGDDTVPQQGWLAAHARAQEEELACAVRRVGGLVGVVGRTDWHPRVRRTGFLDYINERGLQFGYALIEDPNDVPFNFFYTSNLSVDREAIAAEPFDEAFPHAAWEDIEAAYRLQARGLRLLYRPGARVAHDHPTDLARFGRRQYRAGYSAAVFFRRHPALGPFLGLENGAPPPAGGLGASALGWVEQKLARVLQRSAIRLPRLWERTMRRQYLEGLRDGWSDGVGLDRRSA